ncbi:DsrE family protein [Thiomicrorhabdus lithotrophica]|uniref:DsrE family protein n=1 Tax=Thiomicrorhabdus lithotrophica TaxID=2949997 RepID=A0ABY8CDD8_9GAMM|nr:DsrE family protein [Thiomicrorhabdus lithotrophica]WEJ63242.1 DsrE family protein [Thiomicrorhabdus lithotrophica]
MRLLISSLMTLSLLTASYSVHAASDATSTASNNFQLKPVPELQDPPTDRFPGDPAEHKAVYMFNKSDAGYQTGILNSIQAMIKRYGDNVEIAVVAIGPGLHVLAKEPKREVDALTYERVASFAKDYNVRWIACGNTMNTIHWEHSDMRPFAEYAEVGAAALMELQEEGYKPLVW